MSILQNPITLISFIFDIWNTSKHLKSSVTSTSNRNKRLRIVVIHLKDQSPKHRLTSGCAFSRKMSLLRLSCLCRFLYVIIAPMLNKLRLHKNVVFHRPKNHNPCRYNVSTTKHIYVCTVKKKLSNRFQKKRFA